MIIKVAEDLRETLEKGLHYRFWDKARERSNHAAQIAGAGITRPQCPHLRIAWSGPPHNAVQAITCLDCGGCVTEPEMKDRGYRFEDCPDWIFFAIMEEKRDKVLHKGNPVLFVPHK